MFSILSNLAKAAVAVAVTPVTLAVDIVSLPGTAYGDGEPFEHTAKALGQASKAFDAAVDLEEK